MEHSAPRGFNRKLIAPLVAGSVLNPVNSTIISVALVPIGIAFGAPPSATVWLISALYLATAVGQPVVGRLIDLFGPRRLFLPATALVGIAGIIGSLAPNLGVLILARVLLGFGTCAGYPAAMRLIRDEGRRTGEDRPAGVLAILAVANQTVSIIGPVLGGLLIGLGGWRWTMLVNIPLALAAFGLGWLRFPKDDVAAPVRQGHVLAGIDLPGMVAFAVAVVTFLLFLMHPAQWWLAVIALAAGAAFVARELRCATPFIDVRVFAGNTPLMLTYLQALLMYVVSYSFLYGFTQWLQDGRGLHPTQAGFMTLPMFATAIGVSALTGRKEAVRAKMLVTGAGQLVGCLLLLLVSGGTSVWAILGIMLLFGIPQGLGSLALQNSVYRTAHPDAVASSAGLLRTFGYLGAITSSAAVGRFFGKSADTVGMHHLVILLVGVSAAFLLLCFVRRSPGSASSAAPRSTDSHEGATT